MWNSVGTSPGMRAAARLVAVGVILQASAKFVREMGQVRIVCFLITLVVCFLITLAVTLYFRMNDVCTLNVKL